MSTAAPASSRSRRLALVAGALGTLGGACTFESTSDVAPAIAAGDLRLSPMVLAAPLETGAAPTMAGYLRITNTGDRPDTLLGVASERASAISLHETVTEDGGARMTAQGSLEIPPHGVVRFAPGGRHVMLEGLRGTIAAGDTVPIVLSFTRAGRVEVPGLVVPYEELEERLAVDPSRPR